MEAFNIIMPKEIIFGIGKTDLLADKILRLNTKNVLLLTGSNSLYQSGAMKRICNLLSARGITLENEKIASEPTIEVAEQLSEKYRNNLPGIIVSIGGGSVIDVGKMLSVTLLSAEALSVYVDGKALPTKKIPHIAVPTTAGTGSEITPYAVFSNTIEGQRKVKFFGKELLPDLAIVDPLLSLHSPNELTLNSGLDALCHIFEAYIAKDANPFIDDLMPDALKRIFDFLPQALKDGSDDVEIHSELAYSAMMSGIASANTSLGVLHEFVYVIGGMYNIAHSALSAALLYPCMLINMQRVQTYDPYGVTLNKFAKIGSMLSGIEQTEDKHWVLLRFLSEKLAEMDKELKVKKLSALGVKKEDFYKIITAVEQNGNPVDLNEADMLEILELAY